MFKIVAPIFLLLLMLGCDSGSASSSAPNSTTTESSTTSSSVAASSSSSSNEDETEPSAEVPITTKDVYLSYDDSASTASLNLVKYSLDNNEHYYISSSLGRSWEFLNFEEFTSSSFTTHLPFNISIGMLKTEHNSSSNLYELGIHIESETLSNTQRDPLVLTILVDISGSMGEETDNSYEASITLMQLLKNGLGILKNNLIEDDIINLVTFNSNAHVVIQDLNISGESAKDSFQTSVDSLSEAGSTNLDEGIKKAYELANASFDSSKQNRVIILTDAYANTGEVDASIISNNTKINNAEGIYFSGLGYGANFNEDFLNELTEAGKGAYFSILNAQDNTRAFDTKLQALLHVAARDVEFKVTYPDGLQHSISASEESSTEQNVVSKTNFSYNSDQYFYEGFYTTEHGLEIEDENISFTITYKDPITYEEKSIKIDSKIDSLLTLEQNNIQEARLISSLAFVIAGSINCTQAREVVEKTTLSTDLALEYKTYITTYCPDEIVQEEISSSTESSSSSSLQSSEGDITGGFNPGSTN